MRRTGDRHALPGRARISLGGGVAPFVDETRTEASGPMRIRGGTCTRAARLKSE